jgi:prepilin-type processing-associated H-X9-DG protein
MSNMKQIGVAIHMYTDDEDGTLPGPCWSGARASYDKNSSQELIWFIATYLSYPAPSPQTRLADVFMCPGFRRQAVGLSEPPIGVKCALLSTNADPTGAEFAPPFGYPQAPLSREPLKVAQLDKYGVPLGMAALTDLDLINASGAWPGNPLPLTPVHGNVRNSLFFDGHVEAVRAW